MQAWIRRQNIEQFRRLLAITTDEQQRRILLRLLAEEKAKELPAPRALPDD